MVSKLSRLFGDVEPEISEEVKSMVEERALDFSELNEVQLWDGLTDVNVNEVEDGKLEDDGAVTGSSNEEEEWDVLWGCAVEERVDEAFSDEAADVDINELVSSSKISEYEEKVSEVINEEETA